MSANGNIARTGPPLSVQSANADKARRTVLMYLAQGWTVKDALKKAGRKLGAYEHWRANTPGFKEAADRARATGTALRTGTLVDDEPDDEEETFPDEYPEPVTSQQPNIALTIRFPRPLHNRLTEESEILSCSINEVLIGLTEGHLHRLDRDTLRWAREHPDHELAPALAQLDIYPGHACRYCGCTPNTPTE